MTSASPVTEAEVSGMQDFFNRISSTVVAHSTQARELQQLKGQMAELSSRLDALTNESANLRSDLSQAWNTYEICKRERDEALGLKDEMAADAMAARTETVNVRQESDRLLAVAGDECKQKDDRICHLEGELRNTEDSRARWIERSNNWERLAKDSAEKLSLVQAKLADMNKAVRSLFEPSPAEAEQPKSEPQLWAEPKPAEVINVGF